MSSRPSVDDMLDAEEFDPSDLENVDEDALLSESVLDTSDTTAAESTTIDQSVESILSGVCEMPQSAQERAYDSHQIFSSNSTQSFNIEPSSQEDSSPKDIAISSSSCTNRDNSALVEKRKDSESEEENEHEKSPNRDKFKSEKIILRSGIDRTNIPDSLDDVKISDANVKGSYQSRKNFDKQQHSKYTLDDKQSLKTKTSTRVWLNPHFKGSVVANQIPMGVTHILPTVSLVPFPVGIGQPTTLRPIIAPALIPPPVIIPESSDENGGSIQRQSNLVYVNPLIAGKIDITKPPPLAANLPCLTGNKEDWLGATEDFLRKLHARDSPDPPKRPIQPRHTNYRRSPDEYRRRKYVSPDRTFVKRRRSRSSSSATSSDSLDSVKIKQTSSNGHSTKNRVDGGSSTKKVEESPIGMKKSTADAVSVGKSLCDDNYLKQLEDQKRRREEILRLKEKRRQAEMSKKQPTDIVPEQETNAVKKSIKITPIIKPKKSTDVDVIHEKQIDTTEEKSLTKATTIEQRRRLVRQIRKKSDQSKSSTIDDLSSPKKISPPTNQNSRRVVLPPGSTTTTDLKRVPVKERLSKKMANDEISESAAAPKKILRLHRAKNGPKLELWTNKKLKQ